MVERGRVGGGETKGGDERRFAHQIFTKQLKVILGFESGKRWKE